jgi:hypothetical protein
VQPARHLEVRDARFLEHLAARREPLPGIEACGAALRMQQDLAVAPGLGRGHQRLQQLLADPAAAQNAAHRHAADLRHALMRGKQPAGADGLAQAVVGHGMQRNRIVLVPLQVLGDALLLHEHLGADAGGVGAELRPCPGADLAHRLARLETGEQFAQCRRYRARGLGGRVGEHINQLGRDQQLFAAEDRALEGHRGRADTRALQRDIQPVVHQRRGVEFHGRLLQVDVAFQQVHGLLVRHRQRPPVIGHRGVEVHQVVGVEDDFLHVHLGPAHAQTVEESEVLLVHGAVK